LSREYRHTKGNTDQRERNAARPFLRLRQHELYPLLEKRPGFRHRRYRGDVLGLVLPHLNQGFAVLLHISTIAENAGVAIHFDSAAKTMELPPEQRAPWHGHKESQRDGYKQRIACLQMRLLVGDDVPLLLQRLLENPCRHDDA
jgi:hypothetical protein